MFKRLLLLGLISGVLAGIAALIYQKVYSSSVGADFSNIAKPAGIMISNVVGCIIASVGYWILNKWLKEKTEIVFNFIFVILSFASIIPAIGATSSLPLRSSPSSHCSSRSVRRQRT